MRPSISNHLFFFCFFFCFFFPFPNSFCSNLSYWRRSLPIGYILPRNDYREMGLYRPRFMVIRTPLPSLHPFYHHLLLLLFYLFFPSFSQSFHPLFSFSSQRWDSSHSTHETRRALECGGSRLFIVLDPKQLGNGETRG